MTEPRAETPDDADQTPAPGSPATSPSGGTNPLLPAMRDPAKVAAEDFEEWLGYNAHVRNDAKRFQLLSWQAEYFAAQAVLLKQERVFMLERWREQGLTIDEMGERGGLSYSRIRELLPAHLRSRRPRQPG